MQALILAAGVGKRLGEYTKNKPKCMVKVNGITLIQRMLKQLDELKLNKIILVIGYEGEQLQNLINSIPLSTTVDFIFNPVYDRTNNIYSLYLAKENLLLDDTLLLESDLILEGKVLGKLMNCPFPDLALVARYETWMDGTVVTLDELNNILSFIPREYFSSSEKDFYYKTVNIYKFTKEFSSIYFLPFLEAYILAFGRKDYYEQVLRIISFLNNKILKALLIDGEKWYEIDNKRDLNIAESIFAS